MPVRFRKSFKLFPGVKVNMSKGGVSFTVGAKGYHLNFSKRGVRQTVGLPGSGISETSYLIKNDPETSTKKKSDTKARDDESDVEKVTDDEEIEHPVTSKRRAPVWVLLFGLAVIYFGAIFLGLIPNNFLSQLFHTLTEWSRGLGL